MESSIKHKNEMKTIFIAIEDKEETSGHGESRGIKTLDTYGLHARLYPAFKTREEAQAFVDKVKNWFELNITELPIWIKQENERT